MTAYTIGPYFSTFSRMVPGVGVVVSDDTLLSGETDGLAVDFLDVDDLLRNTWDMMSVQERNASVDTLQSPHVFFTQAGTSPKYVRVNGTEIGWSPHNLAVRSETLDHGDLTRIRNDVTADAVTAPDGTATADTATCNETHASGAYITQIPTVTSVSGQTYTFSLYAKKSNNDWIVLQLYGGGTPYASVFFNLGTGTIGSNDVNTWSIVNRGIEDVGGGWYRLFMATTVDVTSLQSFCYAVADGDLDYSCTDNQAVHLWGWQVNRGHVPTAYIATTSSLKVGLPISYGEGLLVEPAATNLCLQSQTIANGAGWSEVRATLSANTTAAPDGSITAETLTINGEGGNNHLVNSDSITTTASTVYTASIYLKQSVTTRYITVSICGDGSTQWYATTFDIQGVTVGTQAEGAAGTNSDVSTITSIGNGWYRVSVTGQHTDANSYVQIAFATSSNPTLGNFGVELLDGNSTDAFSLWGAQLELGSVATSYIPTVSATATRAADKVEVDVSAFGYSQTVGTAYHQYILFSGGDPTWDFIEGPSDFIWAQGGDTLLIFDGSEQVNMNDGAVADGVGAQVTCAWAANDFAISTDGTSPTTDATGTVPGAVVRLAFYQWDSGGVPNFLLRRFIYVPRRVSDGDLPTWRYEFGE